MILHPSNEALKQFESEKLTLTSTVPFIVLSVRLLFCRLALVRSAASKRHLRRLQKLRSDPFSFALLRLALLRSQYEKSTLERSVRIIKKRERRRARGEEEGERGRGGEGERGREGGEKKGGEKKGGEKKEGERREEIKPRPLKSTSVKLT